MSGRPAVGAGPGLGPVAAALGYTLDVRGGEAAALEVDGGRVGGDANTAVVGVATVPMPMSLDGEKGRNVWGFGWKAFKK